MTLQTTIIPSVREVIYTTYALFPSTGLTVGDLAWATDRLCLYRWSGSAWENISISSRHGNYADIGDPADYPESSLYRADDTGALYMVVSAAWVFVATSSALFGTQNVVTGSRAFNTVYQNTTGKPILVVVTSEDTTSDAGFIAYCDSNASPTTIVAKAVGGTYTDCWIPISFIVPNGYYYKAVRIGSVATVFAWVEYS